MSEADRVPTAFLASAQRMRMAFAQTLNDERARAVRAGLPGDVVLEGTLTTLLWFAARVAARLIFPGDDPDRTAGRARVGRVEAALTQALTAIMARERGSPGGPAAPPGPDDPAGPA